MGKAPKQEKAMPFLEESFEFDEFVNFCSETPPGDKWIESNNAQSLWPKTKWSGYCDMDSAISLARNGWAEGAAKIQQIIVDEDFAQHIVTRNTWE